MSKSDQDRVFPLRDMVKKVRIGILTTRSGEEDEINKRLDKSGKITGGKNPSYKYSTIDTVDKRQLHIASLRIDEKGGGDAQAMTTKFLVDFEELTWLFLVGIAGSPPSADQSLGDIVLAKKIVDLSVSKSNDGEMQFDIRMPDIHNDIVDISKSYSNYKGYLSGWHSSIRNSRPKTECPKTIIDPRLYGEDTDWKRLIVDSMQTNFKDGHTRSRTPKDRFVTFASVNERVKDVERMKRFVAAHPNIESIEMELAGVQAAITNLNRQQEVRLFCIRAISDIVGLKRNEAWTAYAEKAAARYTAKLLRSGLIIPEGVNFELRANHRHSKKATKSNRPETQHSKKVKESKPAETASPVWLSPLPEQVRHLPTLGKEQFNNAVTSYSKLFSTISSFDGVPDNVLMGEDSQLLDRISDWLRQDDSGTPLAVTGPVGTGKSTLMSLLAILHRRNSDSAKTYVNYINLHKYDDLQSKDGTQETYTELAKRELLKDLKQLKSVSGTSHVVLYVDGFDWYGRDRVPAFQHLFKSEVDRLEGITVMGVGECDKEDEPYARKEESLRLDYRSRISIRAVVDSQMEPFLRKFTDVIHDSLENSHNYCLGTDLIDRVKASRISKIDFLQAHILSLLPMETLGVSKDLEFGVLSRAVFNYLKQTIERESEARPLGSVAEDYIHDRIFAAARYIYFEDIVQSHSTSEKTLRYQLEHWGVFTAHPQIRAFLRAYYIIHHLSSAGAADDTESTLNAWRDSRLSGYVFANVVNQHSKWLLNDNQSKTGEQALNAIEIICNQRMQDMQRSLDQRETTLGLPELQAASSQIDIIHLCYLLGRFTKEDLAKRAQELLKKLRMCFIDDLGGYPFNISIDAGADPDNTTAPLRLIQCTLLISSIHISDNSKERYELSKKYAELLNDKLWRDLACGFHLEYYGDRPFASQVDTYSAGKKDPLCPFPYTLDVLLPRLEKTLHTRLFADHPLFDVEFMTICVMAIMRKCVPRESVSRQSSDRCLDRVLKLLRNRPKDRLHDPLESIAQLTTRVLQPLGITWPQSIMPKLYEVKNDTLRTGWVEHLGLFTERNTKPGHFHGDAETVAGHSWSAMLLAELLLPESLGKQKDYKHYSKSEVIRILLVHDLPEAVIGDYKITPTVQYSHSHDGEVIKREQDWIGIFGQLGLLPGYFDCREIETRWNEMQDRSSINGYIANTLDKLDTLIQLVIYRKRFPESVESNMSAWAGFYTKVKGEMERASEKYAFTRDLRDTWLRWANSQWALENDQNGFMYHDTIFSDTEKYYPIIGVLTRKGSPSFDKSLRDDTHDPIE